MPASPLLLLVPYRYKAAVLYSQIPISASASGDFVVSRAGNTASRILGNGNIETGVLANIARINYPRTGVASGCAGLLVEPASTNFAPYVNLMNVFDTPTVSGGVTLTTGSTDFLAPDGTSGSINKYVGGTATNQSTRYSGAGVGVSASGTYRFSLFVKAGATNPLNFCAIQFALFTGASGTATSYFSLASGTALTAGASIENYGNGWYRCISAPYTIAAGDLSGTVSFNFASSSGSVAWAASGALDLTAYTWGAQMEAGSVATSYIPTTTAAVTRNADVSTNNPFVIPNLIGAILTEFESPTSGTYFVDNLPVTLVSGYNKVAISYTPTTITVYRNGTQVSGSPFSPPGGVLPILGNVINIGHNNQYYQLGANIRSFVLYSSTLTAAEASGLTT